MLRGEGLVWRGTLSGYRDGFKYSYFFRGFGHSAAVNNGIEVLVYRMQVHTANKLYKELAHAICFKVTVRP